MDKKGLIYGFYFNTDKTREAINSSDDIDINRSHWLHFDYSVKETQQWLQTKSQLNSVVINALLNEETRPRATIVKQGLLIALRGVNLAPNSNPEDMVSIRVWVEKDRIISTRKRSIMSVHDLVESVHKGAGPTSPIQVVVQLVERLMARMTDTINDIEDKVSEIEETILTTSTYGLRNEISDLRRQVISLRRYLMPQREAIQQLLSDKFTLFSSEDKIHLRESADQLIRYVEELESIKDRAAVSQEELNNRINEQMNNRMYVLSIVAAIFLPLGFLTGLLGINVGGIPGSDNSHAFVYFILFLVIIVAVQVLLFKRKKWF